MVFLGALLVADGAQPAKRSGVLAEVIDGGAVVLVRVVGTVEQAVAAVRPRNAHEWRRCALEADDADARRIVHVLRGRRQWLMMMAGGGGCSRRVVRVCAGVCGCVRVCA